MYDALPVMFDHQWCGVTQLGWDEKSAHKIAQMLALNLPPDIACAVTAEQVAGLTGVDTGCGGITYPAGGWLCPQQLTAELLALAATRGLHVHYGYPVETLSAEGDGWLLNQQRYHQAVVLANGHRITGLRKQPNCRPTRLAARSAIFPPPRGLPPCARCCATTAT